MHERDQGVNGACQCALQGLEIMQVETLPGKELDTKTIKKLYEVV